MKSNRKLILVLTAFATVLFNACVDQDDFDFDRLSQSTISPQVEANLMTMEFKASDFFSQIEDTANGVYLIAQNDTLHLNMVQDFTLSGDDLQHDYFNKNVAMNLLNFNLDDITVPSLPSGMTFDDDWQVVNNETIEIEIDEFAKYDNDEAQRMLDSVLLSAGKLNITANSNVPYEIRVELSSHQIVNDNNGEDFHKVLSVGKKSNLNNDIDLTNYKMKFNAKGDNTSAIILTYSVTVIADHQDYQGGTYGFDLKLDGQDLNIDVAWGLIGNPTIPIDGELAIEYFDSTISKDALELERINMLVNVTNYTGLDLFLNLDDLQTQNYNGLISKIFDEGKQISIEKALIPHQPKTTTHNLAINPYALTSMPNKILYDIKSIFGTGYQKGWIAPNGKYLDLHTLIDIPLVLKVNDFASEKETDALEFLTDEDGVGDYIDSVVLKLNFENSFPADMLLELYSKDEYGFIAPLLDEGADIDAAVVDNTGKVVAPAKKQKEIAISAEHYKQLRNADKIILKATFNTATANGQKPFVMFNNDCSLVVSLGIRANTNIKF